MANSVFLKGHCNVGTCILTPLQSPPQLFTPTSELKTKDKLVSYKIFETA